MTFETKVQLIQDWLDRQIQIAKNRIANEKLSFGEDESIQFCGVIHEKALHIYEGIEKLAFYLRATITYNPVFAPEYPDRGEAYFYYNGWRIFEIWTKEVEDDKSASK